MLLGSSGPIQGLAEGKECSSQLLVHQGQWLSMASAQGERSRRESSAVLLQSICPGAGPHPFCDHQPEHILTRVSSRGPGPRRTDCQGQLPQQGQPTPPTGLSRASLPSPRRACPWAPAGLSGAACSERGTPLPTVQATIKLHPFRTRGRWGSDSVWFGLKKI